MNPFRRPSALKVGKFAIVGLLNTAVDFIVLNLLLLATGAQGTAAYLAFKAISFCAAAVNSFFLNKRWVFRSTTPVSRQELASFGLVSASGLFINAAVSSCIFALLSYEKLPLPHIVLANAGALCGTAVVLLWNFLGYQRFVFKNPARA